ncbi:Pyridoxal-dependent decarboxylase conserved domain [seawater metagenome]|uniref:Pyridoxal-dependent decarboxylase conserved domain n=1 Tax=seawater metagenome TaxID=1561972 RepID=A0A5E8CHE9_9ZZZZ
MDKKNLLDGMSKKQVLDNFRDYVKEQTFFHFGYPYNLEFNNSDLKDFLDYSINNLGDPFEPSNYGVHSRQFEIKVLNFFAELWKIDSFWGYVTNSGTEGNLQAMIVARENLHKGIIYTSVDTHYSVFKAAKFYRMDLELIPSNDKGEIDLEELESRIIKNKELPIILNLNLGTTVKGAIDDVKGVLNILQKLDIPKENYYIHCDGALYAMILPFIDNKNKPIIDFTLPIDSLSVSGHKFIGAPMPCGIFLTRSKNMEAIKTPIEYLNSVDTTITGSRNGHASLYIWNVLVDKGFEGFKEDAIKCTVNAKYMYNKIKELGIYCFINDFSTTIVLERPRCHKFIKKWQLACEKNIAHVVIMPSVNKNKIDLFVNEIAILKDKGQIGT